MWTRAILGRAAPCRFLPSIRCYPMHIENPATANVERSSQYDPTLSPIRSWPAPASLHPWEMYSFVGRTEGASNNAHNVDRLRRG